MAIAFGAFVKFVSSIRPDERPRFLSPMALGEWNERPEQARIIEAYKKRIKIARRKVLTKAKIGLFQVARPDNKGEEDDRFLERMKGYRSAASLGMFDELDYLCPPLYARFGSDDYPRHTATTVNSWIRDSTRQGIEESISLRRSDGTAIPLAPYLSFWAFNPPIRSRSDFHSEHNRKEISPEIMNLQLQVLREYCAVEIIILWSGSEDASAKLAKIGSGSSVVSVDLTTFFPAIAEIPISPCYP